MLHLLPNDEIEQLPCGEARCLFLDDISDGHWRRLFAEESLTIARIAACHLPTAPRLDVMLNAGIKELAVLATLLWPRWYGDQPIPLIHQQSLEKVDPEALLHLAATHPRIRLPWLHAAASLCCKNHTPLPPKFPQALQAQQLAAALTPKELLLLFIHAESGATATTLNSLAHAANWFARQTEARVLLILPLEYQYHTALDTVSYQALTCTLPVIEKPPVPIQPKPQAWVWPLIGRPHPNSEGEQRLAQALSQDAELKNLFEFNVRVHSIRGRNFIVDLLWRAGRVIVEVDGYYFHHAPSQFSSDRQRDYELLLSGYTVLRLPHDEVLADTALAVAKIRDVVRFQSAHPRSHLELLK